MEIQTDRHESGPKSVPSLPAGIRNPKNTALMLFSRTATNSSITRGLTPTLIHPKRRVFERDYKNVFRARPSHYPYRRENKHASHQSILVALSASPLLCRLHGVSASVDAPRVNASACVRAFDDVEGRLGGREASCAHHLNDIL
ncbi:hypothetical protein EVAR_52781_1 [Eumeta japonica]|uniref:Uncharacterized protein n=1 Tax=Eumeta variegata TaxID=151549 RepID=A0A4C1Z8Q8_EUMVA|nr:hypothetical protein EVAR_52781_1 [Eumeta japonica]